MARSLANRLRQRNIDFDRRVVQDRESEVAALREQRVKDMVRDRQTHPVAPTHRDSTYDGVALLCRRDGLIRSRIQTSWCSITS